MLGELAIAGRLGALGGSAGNLLLLLGQQPDGGEGAGGATSSAPSRHALARTFGSQPSLQAFRHPQDFGVEVRHAGQDEPLPMVSSRSNSSAASEALLLGSAEQAEQHSGPDALGFVLMAAQAQPPGRQPGRQHPPSTVAAGREASAGEGQPQPPPPQQQQRAGATGSQPAAAQLLQPHTTTAAPAPERDTCTHLPSPSSSLSGSSSLVEALPDDVLRSILMMLDPLHRHVASAACDKLLGLALPTFHAMALTLPPLPLHAAGTQAVAQAPAALRQTLASLPPCRFDSITRLELVLPVAWDRRQLRTLEEPCAPLNAWLGCYLATGHAAQSLESLALRSVALPAPPGPVASGGTGRGASGGLLSSSLSLPRGGNMASAALGGRRSLDMTAMPLGAHNQHGARASSLLSRVISGTAASNGAGVGVRSGAARPDGDTAPAGGCGSKAEEEDGEGAPCACGRGVGSDGDDDDEVAGPLEMDEPSGRTAHSMGAKASCSARQQQCSQHAPAAHPSLRRGSLDAPGGLAGSVGSGSNGKLGGGAGGGVWGELSARERGAFMSGRALHLLATHCPALRRLSVPLLAPSAAPALPALAGQLTHFSCAIQDSTLLSAVFQLRGLTSLRLSLHDNLLSCMLNQAQLAALAQVQGLRSLWLSGVLLPDTDASWRHLASLTALTELRVSAPFSAAHLQHVPGLRMLQVPTFSEGGAMLQHLALHLTHLEELRCRQALCVAGALALRDLGRLTSLQLDSLKVADELATQGLGAAVVGEGGQQQQQQQPPHPPVAPDGTAMATTVAVAVQEVWAAAPHNSNSGAPAAPAAAAPAPNLASAQQQQQQQAQGAGVNGTSVPLPREPPSPFLLYAGLENPSVTSLVLTGVYEHQGELGALFPNLVSCAIAAVKVRPMRGGAPAPRTAPLPRLQRLAFPACAALPQVLCAAPALTSLTVTAVTGAEALLQALLLPSQRAAGTGTGAALANTELASGAGTDKGIVAPVSLSRSGSRSARSGSHHHHHHHHAHHHRASRRSSQSGHEAPGLSSSSSGGGAGQRERESEAHGSSDTPSAVSCGVVQQQQQQQQQEQAGPLCRLQHLALVLQGEAAPAGHSHHHQHQHHQGVGSHHQQSKALRAALTSVLAAPLCSSLQSLTLRDLPPTPPSSNRTSGAVRAGVSGGLSGAWAPPSSSAVAIASTTSPAGVRGLLLPHAMRHHQASPMRSVDALAHVEEDEEGAELVMSPGAHSLHGLAAAAAALAGASSPGGSTLQERARPGSKLRATRSSSGGAGDSAEGSEAARPVGGAPAGPGAPSHAVDLAALQACGRLVDEGVLCVALGAGGGQLRSLRVTGAGALTCTGLASAMRVGGTPHLEHLVLTGCPRVRQASAEQLATGRPWLNVTWAP